MYLESFSRFLCFVLGLNVGVMLACTALLLAERVEKRRQEAEQFRTVWGRYRKVAHDIALGKDVPFDELEKLTDPEQWPEVH